MLTKNKIPHWITYITCFEGLIYLWALMTTEAAFVFNKCARNSGRTSSAIVLIILLMIGYYGLKKIYTDEKQKETFQILITLFAFNHLIHFFYVFMTFKSHSTMTFVLSEHLHGFITFISIMLLPCIIWLFKTLNTPLYLVVLVTLFNASYFINKTFLSKVKPDKPAYHNQFGILVISIALLYILYSIYRENRQRTSPIS